MIKLKSTFWPWRSKYTPLERTNQKYTQRTNDLPNIYTSHKYSSKVWYIMDSILGRVKSKIINKG